MRRGACDRRNEPCLDERGQRRVLQTGGDALIATSRRQWLPVVGMLVGVWAALPRFVSPVLNVATSKEIADHVVPAVAVIAVSVVALVLARRGGAAATFMFIAGLAICLAGLWMVATHVPLVAQAARGEPGVTLAATVWHSASATAVAMLGIVWVATYWDAVTD